MMVSPTVAVSARESSAGVLWRWTALVCLAAAGGLHLAGLAAPGANGLVQLYFLLAAVGQLVAAALLAGQVIAGDAPPAWTSALLLTGTAALVALELLLHATDLLAGLTRPSAVAGASALVPPSGLGDGLLATATVAIEVLLIAALLAQLPGPWRRRATHLLLGISALVWCLWLAGAPV